MTAPKNPNNNADANVINVPVRKRKNNNNYWFDQFEIFQLNYFEIIQKKI